MNTWDEVKKHINELIKIPREYIYRGQADSRWKLQTSYHRLNLKNMKLYFKDLEKMKDRVEAWEGRYRNIESDNLELASFVSVLQHNGYPTPLLDWTLSPYIAAYFAFAGTCDSNNESKKVSIYALSASSWLDDYKQNVDYTDSSPHVTLIKPMIKGNIKMILQQSIFTFTNVSDIEGHLIQHGKAKGKTY